MPDIGNDIVSLSCPLNLKAFSRPAYINKFMNPRELEQYNSMGSTAEAAAIFWSCKESAYKIWMKGNPGKAFSPRKFHVKIINTGKQTEAGVTCDSYKFHAVCRTRGTEYVHCIAGMDASLSLNSISLILKKDSGNSTENLVAERLKLPAHSISIRKTGGIPELLIDGQKSGVAISRSHDHLYEATVILT